MLLLVTLFSVTQGPCKDLNEFCASWANAGECQNNPGYMNAECRASCDPACGGKGAYVKPADSWETEDLEVALPDSSVVDVSEDELASLVAEAAKNDTQVVTWFYAPWCKQCKIARPGYEAAAAAAPPGSSIFTRLDCVKYPNAKKAYGVNSYPAFKILRGPRHRWIEMGRTRSKEVITNAVNKELDGPFTWIESRGGLHEFVFEQIKGPLQPDAHPIDTIGQGEALAVAVLPEDEASSDEQAAVSMYRNLSAGCSIRLSPLNFVAITDPSLLPSIGLPEVPVGHLALIQLFAEPDGAPPSEQATPRLVSTPLLPPAAADDDAVDMSEWEGKLCRWSLGHRLPLLLDFDSEPMWGKRAANFHLLTLHALLFVSPPYKELIGVVRRAAARFVRGTMIVMTFMVSGMDAGNNAMLPRYGVNSAFDTPKLVFLDQRKKEGENRQVVYDKGKVTEEGVVAFVRALGLEEVEEAASSSDEKDEL